METLFLGPQDMAEAGRILRQGGLVVFPTETVYGLGGNALAPESSLKIFSAKGRPSDNPLIVHISSFSAIGQVVSQVDPISEVLAHGLWPGPLTLILPRHPDVPRETTGGLDTVGVRIPQDYLAQEFLRHADVPVAAPSANRSGRPSPTAFWMAQRDLEGRVDAIIQGPDTRIGLESTILWVSEKGVHILRPGSIGEDEVRTILDSHSWQDIPIIHGGDKDLPATPGTRYRHYSPSARVQTYQNIEEILPSLEGLDGHFGVLGTQRWETLPPMVQEGRVVVYEDLSEYARQLYRDLVLLDQDDVPVIFLYLPNTSTMKADGLTYALADRIRRAAGI